MTPRPLVSGTGHKAHCISVTPRHNEPSRPPSKVECELPAELSSGRERIAALEQQLAERDDTGDRLATIIDILRAERGPAHPPEMVRLLRLGIGERSVDEVCMRYMVNEFVGGEPRNAAIPRD